MMTAALYADSKDGSGEEGITACQQGPVHQQDVLAGGLGSDGAPEPQVACMLLQHATDSEISLCSSPMNIIRTWPCDHITLRKPKMVVLQRSCEIPRHG